MRCKKVLSIFVILILLMSIMLTGCKKGVSQPTKTGSNESGNTGETAEQSANQDTSEQKEQAAGFADVTLPLTDEKATLTVWAKSDSTLMNACDGDMNNVPFYQELEKQTNVHINWVVPTSGSEQEQFSLLISSGELPDIVFQSPPTIYYSDGNDAAVDDGYFLDLTDLMKQYAPNYLASVAAGGKEVQKSVITDSGKYVGFYDIMTEVEPPWMGYMVRQDWLDELKLQAPVTYDDWENVLTQFKEKKSATAPLAIIKTDLWEMGVGMDVYPDFYQKDGKVQFSLYNNPEGCKEYITLLNKWYSKGLIDPNFASSTSWLSGDPVLVTNGSTGIFRSMYLYPSVYKASMAEGTDFAAIEGPKQSADQTLKYRTITDQYIQGGFYAVSTDCKNPELAVKWLDYLYSDKGSLFANYGVEGDTYTLDADGNPKFTDKVLKNSDGMPFDTCLRMFTLGSGWPAARTDYRRELQGVDEKDAKMMTDWAATTEEYNYPAFASMTAEENSEYSSIYTDIKTYIEENTLQFITGAKDMSEFDSFVEELKGMNIERCIELKQAALDRYNKR